MAGDVGGVVDEEIYVVASTSRTVEVISSLSSWIVDYSEQTRPRTRPGKTERAAVAPGANFPSIEMRSGPLTSLPSLVCLCYPRRGNICICTDCAHGRGYKVRSSERSSVRWNQSLSRAVYEYTARYSVCCTLFCSVICRVFARMRPCSQAARRTRATISPMTSRVVRSRSKA